MSPDFEYFFKASVQSVHSHTVAGIFYFDLPITIFLSFLFHQVVKQNLVANLPQVLQRKFSQTTRLDFSNFLGGNMLIVITSAILGASSHVFWDSFTHNGSYFVRHLAIYQEVHVPFGGINYPLFYALQQISTFVGLTALLTYVFFMPQDFSFPISRVRSSYWIALAILTTALYYLRFWFYSEGGDKVGNMIVTAISAFLFSLCIMGTIKYFKPSLQQA